MVDTKDSTIKIDQHVLIRLPSKGLKLVQLQDSGRISLGKFGSFEVSGILGHPLGSSFEIVDDNTVRVIKSITDAGDIWNADEDVQKQELTRMFSNSAENNQNIIDIGAKIQTLTNDEIDELKKSGASSQVGQLIIEKMIANHGGFDKKTIFSQEKYLKRKQSKFLRRFTVDYLGAAELLEYNLEKDASKILDLSVESLGLLMNYGNIRPGGKYLIIDETGGLLLYAMMERMDCKGIIVLLHENEHANSIMLRYSDYDESVINAVVKPINWLQFTELEHEKIELKEEEFEPKKPKLKEQFLRKRERARNVNEVIDLVEEGNFDGFVSMSTLYMPDVLKHVVPKIGGSRPLVIYNQYKELLAEVQQHFTNDRRILASSIFETRARPYQTIPGRMHPLMTMRSGGGYVLWGTRVFPDESVIAVGKGMKRRREESVETAASSSPASVIEKTVGTSMEPETEEATETQDDEVIET
ncbi:Gcd10 protein [Candida orthopsilosis Co 90-125]|uniref:tRNA (adenine(58)-N(1))-methyltransferase non-catalytic subunit TRM6 n=1 Tax=Candida orthopsilosis (strain 90-125) TaxID=1136231 RepID=H8X4X8_CANO9|nr:Gcd10 protein [Candida orthopsilosis Co 90-125]CCG23071.1 Gcd10 protein [Candida orthopsilosis Co 90-125]